MGTQQPPTALDDQEGDPLADEEDAESLIHSSSDEDTGSDVSYVAAAPVPAAKGRGKGRGRGRGRGDQGRARGGRAGAPAAAPAAAAGQGQTAAVNVSTLKVDELKRLLAERSLGTSGKKAELAARLKAAMAALGGADEPEEGSEAEEQGPAPAAAPAAAAKPSKYTWVDVDKHTFTPRRAWTGEELPTLGSSYDHLTIESYPSEWFKMRDAPDQEYTDRANNSEAYRSLRHAKGSDGKNAAGKNKKCYGNAAEIEYEDMRYLDAYHLLGGLDPAVSREKLHDSDRLAVVGHRPADLFNLDRSQMVRKFHHPADPATAIPKGQPGHDNLHQVSPILKSLSKTTRKADVSNGKKKAIDEETLSFQGASSELKQRCGNFKAAGDGLQGDGAAVHGGQLKAIVWRGHSLLPTVSVKGKPDIKLSDLHSRTLWVMYLSSMEPGSVLAMDNLYNSVDFSHLLEGGATIVFEVPAGWTADVDFTGDESATKIEWDVEAIHVVGTLRGNRGSEKAYQWAEKMSAQAVNELKAKPLDEKIRARVTADGAQVMTVAIYDKKGFQMIDTVHEGVELTTKSRVIFDRAAGKRGKKQVPITMTQHVYNNTMGYVDLDDLLAHFYR